MILGLEVVFGFVALATKVRHRIVCKRNAIDYSWTAMPQYDVWGISDCGKAISDHSKSRTYPFTKDIVDSSHAFRTNHEFAQKCSRFA